MTDDILNLPLYIKASVLSSAYALTAFLYLAKGINVPVGYAVIIAIVLIQHVVAALPAIVAFSTKSPAWHATVNKD